MHPSFLSVLYPESQEREVSVSVVNGVFRVNIGGKRGGSGLGVCRASRADSGIGLAPATPRSWHVR
jgi:hypothetical protein